MRCFLAAVILIVVSPCVVLGDDAKADKPSDTEVYAKAVEAARAARMKELKALLADREHLKSQNPQAVIRAKGELKRLKSTKPMPRAWLAATLRIDILAPKVGQVGTLSWGKLADDPDVEHKACRVEKIIGPRSLRVCPHWTLRHGAVLEKWNYYARINGNPSSIEIGEKQTYFRGDMFLITDVNTAELKEGDTVDSFNIFVVENGATQTIPGPFMVLRALEIDLKKLYKR